MLLFSRLGASRPGCTYLWGMGDLSCVYVFINKGIDSDIDLVISSDSIARVTPANALNWIARALKDRGLAYNVQIIAKAKVPIIKFVTTWGA